MINLSRNAVLGIAALLSLLLILTLAASVSALSTRERPTQVAEAASATAPASTTLAVATQTTATATDTPINTPTDTPTDLPTSTPTEMLTATPTPEPPTVTPTLMPATPTNLLGNPSFELSFDRAETRWSFDPDLSNATGSLSNNVARTGISSISIVTLLHRQDEWPGWTSDPINIESGKTYTFSAWVYSPAGSNALISLNLYNPNGKSVTNINTPCEPIPAGDQWRQMSITIQDQYLEQITQVKLRLQQCTPNGGDIGTTLYYDDVFFGVISP